MNWFFKILFSLFIITSRTTFSRVFANETEHSAKRKNPKMGLLKNQEPRIK
jgi:hypothetical protein